MPELMKSTFKDITSIPLVINTTLEPAFENFVKSLLSYVGFSAEIVRY
jgi:hypothetical protein